MVVETYPIPKRLQINGILSFDYIEVDIGENFEPNIANKGFNKGDILTIIAKIKSKNFPSGYGYIFYDDEIDQSGIIDISFFDIE